MKTSFSDVLVLGAGAAGLAAASKAKELGTKNVVLLDEKEELGGVLPQCIHPGFGLHYFEEDLTGPEFAIKLYERAKNLGVEISNLVYAMELLAHGKERIVRAGGPRGLIEFRSKTVIFATGARERHSCEIGIVGYRPIGVYTAGQAQTMMDLYGVMPGREAVIVGSGDVGLILARRLALQGAIIKAVIEILPYPGGLARNIQQCLVDFEIPLYLGHKARKIHGKKRVDGVTVAKVDENLREIPGTEFEIKCDMIIVSAGLIPRVELLERAGASMDPSTRSVIVNELFQTSISGVFAAGNALIINDLVDSAAVQGEMAARNAVDFAQNRSVSSVNWKPVIKGRNIRLVVPQLVSCERDVSFYGRVTKPEENVYLRIPEIRVQFSKLKVEPSEMVTFDIHKNILEKLEDSKITVAVEPRK
jgi:NADPH-dependent 2,4-dienoyl-CoA reductase/sulfur reductase-like enzyme